MNNIKLKLTTLMLLALVASYESKSMDLHDQGAAAPADLETQNAAQAANQFVHQQVNPALAQANIDNAALAPAHAIGAVDAENPDLGAAHHAVNPDLGAAAHVVELNINADAAAHVVGPNIEAPAAAYMANPALGAAAIADAANPNDLLILNVMLMNNFNHLLN